MSKAAFVRMMRRRIASRRRRRATVLAAALCAMAAFPASVGLAAQTARPAGRVVADSFWSPILGTRKRMLVYLPPAQAGSADRRYPVVYYLHGASGDESDWVEKGNLVATMDSLIAAGIPAMLVVMPDGDDGWYTTWNALGNFADCSARPPEREPAASYCVPWPKYDDYVARDLVAHVDSSFPTMAARANRGIAGLSMGGYGAVTLALRYDDVFGAAASHSGVLAPLLGMTGRATTEASDIGTLRTRWPDWLWPALRLAFGGRDLHGWTARDPARMLKRARARSARALPLLIDTGADDPFTPQNRAFASAARALGADVTYRERPGRHDWPYWRAHLPESLAWLAERVGTMEGARRR